jgi:hypothetical protein
MSIITGRTLVTIYCPSQDIPSARLHQPQRWSPSWTGEIPVETLEEIFLYFNRVEDDDVRRLEHCRYHLPSLSTGDIIIRELPGDVGYHVVTCFGFTEITQKQYLAIRGAKDPRLAALRHAATHN